MRIGSTDNSLVERNTQQEPAVVDVPEMAVGDVIRAWRLHRDMTMTALVIAAGAPVTKSYLSSLETGRIRTPGRLHLIKIADALRVPVSVLMTNKLPSVVLEGGNGGSDHGDQPELDLHRWDDTRVRLLLMRQEMGDKMRRAQALLDEANRIIESIDFDWDLDNDTEGDTVMSSISSVQQGNDLGEGDDKM